MKCKDLQKVKKVKCKKIEEFQSDADEDDEIVEEEIEEEESNKEENIDGNKGEAIHFEEGRAKHRIPSKGTLFENALQTKKRRLLASGLLAYMIQNKVRTFILEEQINNS